MLRNFVLSTNKIWQWDIPRAMRHFDRAMTGFFRRAYQQRVSKNEMRKQFGISADETY